MPRGSTPVRWSLPTLDHVEVLLWLLPSAVVTVGAMLWVGWAGREGRREVDREVAVRRLAGALERDAASARRPAPGYAAPRPERDRSTGIAVRPSRRAS